MKFSIKKTFTLVKYTRKQYPEDQCIPGLGGAERVAQQLRFFYTNSLIGRSYRKVRSLHQRMGLQKCSERKKERSRLLAGRLEVDGLVGSVSGSSESPLFYCICLERTSSRGSDFDTASANRTIEPYYLDELYITSYNCTSTVTVLCTTVSTVPR